MWPNRSYFLPEFICAFPEKPFDQQNPTKETTMRSNSSLFSNPEQEVMLSIQQLIKQESLILFVINNFATEGMAEC